MLTVQDVYDLINERAPFETQEPYDNSGLLVGHPETEVTGIVAALDVTPHVIAVAKEKGANLLVTHHPLMFSARKQLVETDYEAELLCTMIRHGMALISAHTCLDLAPGGTNDALASAIGLTDVVGEGFVRVGSLPREMDAAELAAHIQRSLGDVVRWNGNPHARICRVGLCSGSGSDEWPAAKAMGAQAFLTGEVRYKQALAAAGNDMVMLEAGHRATETPGIFALADALQNCRNVVQCKMCVYKVEPS